MIDNQFYQSGIKSRIESEKASVAFSKIINELWYDKGIETLLFRNPLLDKRNSEILNLHHYAHAFESERFETIEELTELVGAWKRVFALLHPNDTNFKPLTPTLTATTIPQCPYRRTTK